MSRHTAAATARLAAWSVFLALVLRLLHGSTLGTLSIPMESIDELGAWADRTAPAVMALGLVRLAALAGAWYLVVVSILALVADVAGWRGLARAVGAVSPAVVTRLATRGAGAGLVAGALLGGLPLPSPLDATPSVEAPARLATPLAPAPALGAAGPPPQPAVAARTPAAPAASTAPADPAAPAAPTAPAAPAGPVAVSPSSDTATMARVPAPTEATATMTRLPDAARPPDPPPRGASHSRPPTTGAAAPGTGRPGGPSTTTIGRAGTPAVPSPRPGADLPLVPPPGPAPPAATTRTGAAPTRASTTSAGADDEWIVEMGDSFWTIAEEAMTDAHPGNPPSEADVTAYWRRLIDANRDRLAAPGNSDLLLPGQRLALPAVS